MPKLKYDLALAQHDGIIYGIPDDGNDRGKQFLLHGVGAARLDAAPDLLHYYDRVEKGSQVGLKLVLDDGTPAGFRRVVVLVKGEEVFTGDWALE